jgi:quercetin dioxygenase-like cupin family protein
VIEALGEVLSVSDLVEYQDGAVVSRTLIKGPAGSVTLFAFDEGQDLSEHTVPHDALAYVFDGEARITISGTSHRVSSGEMIIMPGNRPHAVVASRKFKMMLVMLRA